MVSLWGRSGTRRELMVRVDTPDQLARVQLAEAGDGTEPGIRLLRAAFPHQNTCRADVIVSGSAIYDGYDPAGNLARLLEQLHSRPTFSPLNSVAS